MRSVGAHADPGHPRARRDGAVARAGRGLWERWHAVPVLALAPTTGPPPAAKPPRSTRRRRRGWWSREWGTRRWAVEKQAGAQICHSGLPVILFIYLLIIFIDIFDLK